MNEEEMYGIIDGVCDKYNITIRQLCRVIGVGENAIYYKRGKRSSGISSPMAATWRLVDFIERQGIMPKLIEEFSREQE